MHCIFTIMDMVLDRLESVLETNLLKCLDGHKIINRSKETEGQLDKGYLGK